MTLEYSLYIHIPFCVQRCAYCDFNTYAGQNTRIPAYVEALCAEIRFIASSVPERLSIHTIFFGGGTPSLLTIHQFEKILHTITEGFILSDLSGLETSLEANPGTLTLDSLREFRRVGLNRISLGVQSFHLDELRLLGRIHTAFDVLDAVRWARKAGFNNLNLDLIYGLPEQTLARWRQSLQRAVALSPQHLSLYALTMEPGTPFGTWASLGRLSTPDPDLAADMYETASDYLAGQGYEQYEISNWSKPGFQCRHNLQYWRNQPYLGFGAGAHGCANDMRISNVLRIKTYLERFSPSYLSSHPSDFPFPISPATITRSRLLPYIKMQETLMLGLRLTREGVSPQAFYARFGQDILSVFGMEIKELVHLELLEWAHPSEGPKEPEILRLTSRGRLLGNQVFMRFVS